MHLVETLINLLRKVPRRVVEILFFAAVIVFFVLYLRGLDWSRLVHLHYDWHYLIAATIVMTIGRYFTVVIWQFILQDLGAKGLPRFTILASVYAKAWLGRYIPGGVTWIAGKVYMAAAHGISKTRLAVGSLLEGAMQVISLLTIAMLLLGFDARIKAIPESYRVVMILFAVVLLLMLSPAVFNRLIRLAWFVVKKREPTDELFINSKAVLRSFLLYAVGSFIVGLAEFFITRTVVPSMSWHNFFFIVGAFNLAGALGMIAIGVPSGLGVRDGALLVLLAAIMPKELALTVVVTSRLWGAFADVVFFGVASFVHTTWRPESTSVTS